MPDTLDVWWIDLDSPRWETSVCQAALPPDELAQVGRLIRPLDARHKLVSRWAAREILAGYLGIRASQVEWRVDEMGKPFLHEGVSFNLSHSAGQAALAVTPQPGRNLGIDLEDYTRNIEHFQLARRFFATPEADYLERSLSPEQTFFHIWTLKEAYVKALGSGLRHPLSEFLVVTGESDWGLFDLQGQPLPGWRAQRLAGPPANHLAALVWDGDPLIVRERQF